MAKANPVTDTPADPATTPTETVTAPVVTETTSVVTPKAKTAPADPLEKFKTVVDGLSIYNFTETAL